MSDPLGLFGGSGGADPLGLFAEDDPFDKIPGGHVKPPAPKQYSAGDYVKGIGEAAYGTVKGAIGGLDAPVRGVLTGLFGKGDSEQAANKAMEEWAYHPKSDLGQEYLQNVGDVVNRYGIPMAGVHIPTARLPKELRGYREPAAAKADKLEPTMKAPEAADPLGLFKNEQLELPLENNPQQIREMQMREHPQTDMFAPEQVNSRLPEMPGESMVPEIPQGFEEVVPEAVKPPEVFTPSQLKEWKQTQDRYTAYKAKQETARVASEQEALQRVKQDQAQAAIEARLREQELAVQKQTNLGMGAAERQRQMQARPAGMYEALMRDVDQSTARTQELNQHGQQMGIVEDFGNNDPMARMPNMRIDENGMPIRADLSMEAANLENPLQRNLWGDELGPALDQVRSLTEAIDHMPPWERASDHIGREVNASPELTAAIEAAHGSNLGKSKGRSQSGAVDFDVAAEALGKIANGMGKVFSQNHDKYDLPVRPIDKMQRMPGVGSAIKDYIPEPPRLEEVKSKILAEGKDGPSLMKMIQSGGINTAGKVRSALIEGVSRQVQYAQKVADRTIREKVQPLETQFRRMPMVERKDVAAIMKKEMFAEQRFTPEQMKEAGFSDRSIKAYSALREQFDLALQNLNEGRALRGKQPVTPKEAYLASRWNGDWHVPLYDKEGKIVWYIREKTRMGANKAVEYLKKNQPEGIDWSRAEATARKSALDPNSPRDMASAYKEFLDMMDQNDPKVVEMKRLYEDMQQSEGYDFMNTKKHFLAKKNVHGFIGDKPWKSEGTNANELFTSQFQYLKEAHRWAETQKVVENVKEFLADPEIQAAQPNNMAYAQVYMQNALGMGVNRAVANLESTIINALGGSRSQAYNATNAAKSVFYLSALGLSPGYMAMNILQPVLGISSHRVLSTEGIGHNILKTLPLTLSDTSAGMLKHMITEMTGHKSDVPMSKLGKEALQYAEENGLISHNIFDENESLSTNRGVAVSQAALGWSIALPEKIGRLSLFMSFAHHLQQSGKFADKGEMFLKAEDLTNEVMVDFRRSERPMLFNKMGLVGENIAPLKSFVFSYFNQMSKYARMAKEGTPTPLLAFLGAQLFLGGVVNMPGMNEMEGLWNGVKNGLAAHFPRGYSKVKDIPGPKEWAASNMPDVAAYGPVSELSGVNMYSRASTSIVDPERPMSDIAPLGSLGNAVGDLATGNGTQFAWDLAPPLVKGLMETNMDSFKARNLETGEQLRDQQGRGKYLKANDIGANEATGPNRSPAQDFKRSFGVRDFQEAKEKDVNYTVNNNARREKIARDTAMNDGFSALVKGDKEKAKEYFRIYADDFNGAESLEKDFTNKLIKYATTPQERMYLKKIGLPIIESIQQKKELMGN